MARRKAVGIIVVAAVIGVAAVATMSESGSTVKTVDIGGGVVPAAAAAPEPYAISTLPPVGTAAQDPGGGGGGTGEPGAVKPPAIQGAQGSSPAPRFVGTVDTIILRNRLSRAEPQRDNVGG